MAAPRRPGRGPSTLLGVEDLETRDTPAAGFFDTTFGTNGVSLTTFLQNGNPFVGFRLNDGPIAKAIAVQPDGKIILAGTADSANPAAGADMAVVRLNADGTLDPTFGAGGRVTIPFDMGDTNDDEANAVQIVAGGRIVVAGYATTGTGFGQDFALARLNSDGSLDGSFGGNGTGKVTTNVSGLSDVINDIAIQGDGKIVAVGSSTINGFAVTRYNSNGVLDGSFNKSGKFNYSTISAFSAANGVAIQPDGKIVVVGDATTLGTDDVAAIRINTNGVLDGSFGKGGAFVAGLAATGGGSGQKVKILPSGSLVIAGSGKSSTSNGLDFALVQVTSSGVLDGSFGGGRVLIPIDTGATNADDIATGVQILADGRIAVSGTANGGTNGPATRFAAARVFSNGTLDTSFGINGRNSFNLGSTFFNPTDVNAAALAFGPNGTLLIAGYEAAAITVVRLTGDGSAGSGGGGSVGPTSLFNSPVVASTDGGLLATYGVSTPGQYNTSLVVRTTGATAFNGFTGLVRSAIGDVNGDTIPDFVEVTGPGTPTQVAVVSGADQLTYVVAPFFPFRGSETFTGGGYVSMGDITGDGIADFAITPDQGGGPRVVVFSAVGGALTVVADFFGIADANFRGGAQTAIGDVNADGTADLAVTAGAGGGPRVALYNGRTIATTRAKLVGDFFAFPDVLRNGVNIAIGDVNGDQYGDLIIGAGSGGGPQVLTINGQTLLQSGAVAALRTPINNFFVNNDSSTRGGVRVVVKNVDGDNKADVIASTGENEQSRLRVYLGQFLAVGGGQPTTFQDLDPFNMLPANGVYVG